MNTAVIIVPGKGNRPMDLPAYARTGAVHSGHPPFETVTRCLNFLEVMEGIDPDALGNLDATLQHEGHPADTGRLTQTQAQAVARLNHRFQYEDEYVADCAELLLNAAGILLQDLTA